MYIYIDICMYIYINVYVYVCMYIYINIYIYDVGGGGTCGSRHLPSSSARSLPGLGGWIRG